MSDCTGAPAELQALPYIEGTLPEAEMLRFEEHCFYCAVCLRHLQALQAVALELSQQSGVALERPRWRMLFSWPAWILSAGAVAALLLIGTFAYKNFESRQSQQAVAPIQPKAAPQTEHTAPPANSTASTIHFSQLADLSLTAYLAPNLRGESLDANFEAGMKKYAQGDCRGAITTLASVATDSTEARAAMFYSGVCQMQLRNFDRAIKILRNVANASDSPQQEIAFFELAQIALAGDDSTAAQAYLKQTIALRGDFEQRARLQEQQISQLVAQSQAVHGMAAEAK